MLKRILAVLVILGLTAGLTELALRLSGRNAGRFIAHQNEPVMLEPDPELGWRNKPGTFIYPGYTKDAPDIHVANGDDGRRLAAPGPVNASRAVVFVGCSFTNGFALSNNQTLAWRIQERLPDREVVNFGTGGWSSHQALLRLERWFKESDKPTESVVYGYSDAHAYRSAAAFEWQRSLDRFSVRGHVAVPHVRLGPNGELVRKPPTTYAEGWPFRRRSALMAELADLAMYVKHFDGYAAQKVVQPLIVAEMNALCRKNGAALVVIPLFDPKKTAQALQLPGARVLDCPVEIRGVPGEGHPDAATNAAWADCLAPALLERRPTPLHPE